MKKSKSIHIHSHRLKTISVIALFALLIGGSIWQSAYLEHTFSDLTGTCSAMVASVKKGDMASSRTEGQRLIERFGRCELMLTSLLEHEEIDNINAELCELSAMLEIGDAEEILMHGRRLEYFLAHIPKVDALSPANIF